MILEAGLPSGGKVNWGLELVRFGAGGIAAMGTTYGPYLLLSWATTFMPIDGLMGSVLICDYTGKEVVE